MEEKYDIIGLANPGQDIVIELEKLPERNTSSKMYDCCFQGGGWVATALCAAGNLGMRVSFLGVVGDDLFGALNFADFRFNNVDTSHLIVEKGKRTNFCMCVTERSQKSKSLISRPGECRQVEIRDLDKEYIQSARVLHVGFVDKAVIEAAKMIREAGGLVSVDAAYYQPYVYENYDIFDIFIGSEYYFNVLCEALSKKPYKDLTENEIFDVIRYVQSQGPKIVIFTFGADGCKGIGAGEAFSLPAMDVKVVDTTGAGDVFHGAFLTAYLNNKSIEEAARYATGVSAIKCTRLGGRVGIADPETLEKFLRTSEIDEEKMNERAAAYQHGLINFSEVM